MTLQYKKIRRQPERDEVSRPLVAFMRKRGWHCTKMHGNMYQQGVPDLYCTHPKFGVKWVETKVVGKKLRATQRKLFREWAQHGSGNIWVINHCDDYGKLFDPPNWYRYV